MVVKSNCRRLLQSGLIPLFFKYKNIEILSFIYKFGSSTLTFYYTTFIYKLSIENLYKNKKIFCTKFLLTFPLVGGILDLSNKGKEFSIWKTEKLSTTE
jgi:hypothetical protein